MVNKDCFKSVCLGKIFFKSTHISGNIVRCDLRLTAILYLGYYQICTIYSASYVVLTTYVLIN